VVTEALDFYRFMKILKGHYNFTLSNEWKFQEIEFVSKNCILIENPVAKAKGTVFSNQKS
jgi:hypothetical protein